MDVPEALAGSVFWISGAPWDLAGDSRGIPRILLRLAETARGHLRNVSGSYSDVQSACAHVPGATFVSSCMPGKLPAAPSLADLGMESEQYAN